MVTSTAPFPTIRSKKSFLNESTNQPPRIVRSKTPNPYVGEKRPRAESIKRARTPNLVVVSPDGDESGPWAQTVNTFTWVLEQQIAADKQRQREQVPSLGRTASVEMRVFEPEWNVRGVPEPDAQRWWEEKAYNVDVQARVWMLQEEARRIAALREAERKRLVQEEVRRIQFRIQMRREAERQKMMDERRRANEEVREREVKRREMADRAVLASWKSYEAGWSKISSSSDRLTFRSIPWPTINPPPSPSSITAESIAFFLFSPLHSGSLPRKDRIKEALRRWHPDRFGRFLNRVIEEEKGVVEEGVGNVARCLNELLSRESQQPHSRTQNRSQ